MGIWNTHINTNVYCGHFIIVNFCLYICRGYMILTYWPINYVILYMKMSLLMYGHVCYKVHY